MQNSRYLKNVHGAVKAEQAFAYAIAGAIPCRVYFLSGVNTDGILLNTKGQGSVSGTVVLSLMGLLIDFSLTISCGCCICAGITAAIAAASGHDTGSQQDRQHKGSEFLELFHLLHLPLFLFVPFRPSEIALPSGREQPHDEKNIVWKIPVAFFVDCCYNKQELNTQMVGAAVSLYLRGRG